MADLRHKGDLGEEPGELVDYSSDQRDDQPASKRILLDQDEGENQSFTRNLQALSSLLAVPNQLNSQQLSTSVHSGIDPNSYTRTIYLGGLPRGATPSDVLQYVKGGPVERFRLLSEKNCAFIDFVDINGAYSFYNRHCLHRFSIKGTDIKLGWAKSTPLSGDMYAAVQGGATRCIFLGSLDNSYNEYTLTNEYSVFGPLESIKVLQEKRIAFIQYLNISSAIKAMNEFGKDPRWMSKRIAFGKDHCANQAGGNPNLEVNNYTIVAEHSLALTEAASSGNRTVYLGNLPEDVSVEELCNTIKTGALHNIRYLPEKNCCFVTFLDPLAAQALYRNAAFSGLFFKGNKLKPGWGKSGPLSGFLQNAIKRGASRTVYIGGISESVTPEELRKDFEQYGETEQIRIIRDKNTAFICFCSIENAIKAIEKAKTDPLYASLKINFGKDRCNPTSSNQKSDSKHYS